MLTTLFISISDAPYLLGLSTIHCESTDLVEWGKNLTSCVGLPRFSPLVASMMSLPSYIMGILIGLVLSDGT